jgi:alpha-aminoadipic semialdehyde synthase
MKVRETYGNWERRAPLSPDHVRVLTERGVRVRVQPSSRRVFADAEYAAAGAEVSEDLEPSDVVLGVKQIPAPNLLHGRPHLFFSHTIKAQQENMALLDACVEKDVTLIDYECIVNVDEQSPEKGKRLVAFGGYAGIVGMVDVLQVRAY